MTERVIVTVEKDAIKVDLDIPVTATPGQIAAALGWNDTACAVVQHSGGIIDAAQSFDGQIREGDLIVFEEKLNGDSK